MNKRRADIRLLVIALALVILVGAISSTTAADTPLNSLFTMDMAGVNASLLTIGMANITDSRLIINTTVMVIEITGVHMYPISCDFGLLRPGDIKATGQVFELYNASNITVDVTIAVEGDWIGSTNWTHSDDCLPGVDIAGLVAVIDDSGSHTSVIVKKNTPYNYLATDLVPGERRQFALEIYAPTSFSDYSRKRNTIFISVEEA